MNAHYPLIALRAYHRCEYCHAPESVFNFPFEVEHIVPLSLDGVDEESNLALACRSCNIYKGSFLDGIDPTTNTPVGLFHPRWHEWERHFQVNRETGELVGLTSTARATINRLRMNSAAQLLARKAWIRLSLFP